MPTGNELLRRAEAENYLFERHGIRVNLARRAHFGTGPMMVRIGELTIRYTPRHLDEFATNFVRLARSSRDEGEPFSLTAA
jgi:hypothetical protein